MKNSIEELVAVWRKKFNRIPLDLPKARSGAIRDLFKQIETFGVSVPNIDILDTQVDVSIVLRKEFPKEEVVWIQILYQILGNFRVEYINRNGNYSAFVKVLTLLREMKSKGYSTSNTSNLNSMIERFLKKGAREFGPREQVSMSLAATVCEYRFYDLFFENNYGKFEDRWIGSEPVLTMLQNQIDKMRGEKGIQEWVGSAIYDFPDREIAQAWLIHTTARNF